MALVKRKVDISNPVEIEYASLVTPYALSLLSKQLALRNKVGIIRESDAEYLVSSSEGVLKVTVDSCECRFWTSTHLPCRHIFAVREKKQVSMFSAGIVAHRWTLDYMKEVYDHKVSTINPTSFQVCVINYLYDHH